MNTNTILVDQNSSKSIRSIKAQRIAYSNAKRFYLFDILVIITALLPTILIPFNINCKEILAIIAVFIAIATLIIGSFASKQTKLGAQIQERFDTELFKIKWNKIFVGKEPDISNEVELANKYKKNDVENWYSTEINQNLPHSIAVILCYKCNTIWGKSQRLIFINFLYIIVFLYYSSMIILGIVTNKGMYDVAVWLAPSLPFLLYCTNQIKNQKDILEKYKYIDEIVQTFIIEYKSKKNIPNEIELRSLQDLFYSIRILPAKIPDWFYYLFKKRSNSITDASIKAIIEEF